MADKSPLFQRRTAGVLLHPTSLPCSETCWGENNKKAFGTLGKDAYYFIDLVAQAGLTIWQMLPTGPTQADMSPYQSISAHAGNPDLISLDSLFEKGWITAGDMQSVGEKSLSHARQQGAISFHKYIESEAGASTRQLFQNFCSQQNYWLDDFALFSALRTEFNGSSWNTWPWDLRKRNSKALEKIRTQLKAAIDTVLFEQFAFFSQWQALKQYANEKGVSLFGDMPIFVGHDSADVWAQQHYFQLDEEGNPLTVAGVPPDYFSETGQHWGNPHYAWEVMAADGFQWWLARLRTQLQLFDLIRIDHFRGFEAYWEIPGKSHDARLGKWVKAPGEAFLQACFEAYPGLPLVAENLGVITDEVEALRNQFELPGMLVLQFAFDGNTSNPHLPHNHTRNDVIYTGTHDNDTTVGWFATLSDANRQQVKQYCFNSADEMPWLLIEAALASVGRMAIIPMQDFLELDGGHRMNMPGTTDKNWVWTFSWDQVDPTLAERIRQLLTTYNRLS
ncbi:MULTISPECIES: 4-alpha-glucanotransferase [Cellvibrio]|uniref:4-alpha-glucanotransferase n=1 Tax=Cellvibrio fibrivorans TaxID=126350 RepID=A0ABU1UWN0_9GAMM|nr:4-alpha-glucanotransferase [Cellvibrio fibrivorans]MDR7089598.1 4-alpha-glucanotransferase [Cellvibrio fibrivorans]